MKALLFVISLLMVAVAAAEPVNQARIELVLRLLDGSTIKAMPAKPMLAAQSKHGRFLTIDWGKIQQVQLQDGRNQAKILLDGGDRLTAELAGQGIEVDSSLGRLHVPIDKLRVIEVSLLGGPVHNIALGKPVHGRDGASHGKGLAKHVTDGDPETHAKPPGSTFEYRVDLQNGKDVSFGIKRIVINWGQFGDKFVGVRKQGGEQWASGAWPGEYVTSYVVECRNPKIQEWMKVHEFKGRPVDEKAAGVEVIKRPSEKAGCNSEVMTVIDGLHIKNAAELRIRARGGHWIGLYEFEAHGHQE